MSGSLDHPNKRLKGVWRGRDAIGTYLDGLASQTSIHLRGDVFGPKATEQYGFRGNSSADVAWHILTPENMSGDSRKDFLVATIGNHFGYHTGDGAVSHIYDSTELNSFLDNGNCGVLGARVELTQDVKIVQVYSDTLPEMELQGDRWGWWCSASAPSSSPPTTCTLTSWCRPWWKRPWRASIMPCRRCTRPFCSRTARGARCVLWVGHGGLAVRLVKEGLLSEDG